MNENSLLAVIADSQRVGQSVRGVKADPKCADRLGPTDLGCEHDLAGSARMVGGFSQCRGVSKHLSQKLPTRVQAILLSDAVVDHVVYAYSGRPPDQRISKVQMGVPWSHLMTRDGPDREICSS